MRPLAYTALAALLAALPTTGCATLPQPPPREDATPLRVVSWNIGLGVFIDQPHPRLSRLSREGASVRNALAHHPDLRGFDLLALQEVCSHEDGKHLRLLDRTLPFQRVFARSDPARPGECQKGEAIYSRFPITASGVLQLPAFRRVGRSALWADVSVPTPQRPLPLRIYNLHLDNASDHLPAPEARWRQLQPVLKHAAAWRQEHPEGAALLVGDFNTAGATLNPWAKEPAIDAAERAWQSALQGHHATWFALFQLDWIFYANLELRRARVVPLLLSDHRPLTADLLLLHPKPDAPLP